jgi:hypothetical protein
LAWLSNRLPPLMGSGFRTTCLLAGASPWRGSKEARAPWRSLESGVPATVFARIVERGIPMAAVMIGVDPHKASHTAVAISAAEEPLGELRVRACVAQAGRLLAWATAWPQRTWAAGGRRGGSPAGPAAAVGW